jgi:UDP-galactopyranose mutase
MPLNGYTKMFESMLNHPNIHIQAGVEFSSIKSQYPSHHIIYTGPIDEYFNYCFGKLPYRSLRFEHEHFPQKDQFQEVGTINYPNDHQYTRITEFKHLTGQQHSGTSTVKEYPQSEGDPYYPIPNDANEELFRRYEALAKDIQNVTFVGRLAQYRYYNMDQVVGAALTAAERLIEQLKE